MNKINGEWVNILNVLALLREKPMTFEELMKSGCFKYERHLEFTLYKLKQSGCIEKIKAVGIYCILGHGITLLSFYPTWRPLPVEVLDIVDPLFDQHRNERFFTNSWRMQSLVQFLND